jgi:hypothetical protein
MEAKTIARALKLLETQKKASKAYYLRHKEVVKAKSVAYWEEHREDINTRRRARYALQREEVEKKKLEAKQNGQGELSDSKCVS